MRVLWIGMDDSDSHTLNFHDLRCHLRDRYGVELVGPGYTMPPGPQGPTLSVSEILREHGVPDWVIYDDCNANGYVRVIVDMHPPCKVAYREHDWWNRHRRQSIGNWSPDLILSCYDRPLSWRGANGTIDVTRRHRGWRLVPHPVNTDRFSPDGVERRWSAGFYGKHGKLYEQRTKARRVLVRRAFQRRDTWIGNHGGYWRFGEMHDDGVTTFYNENLAAALRQVKCLWVDGLDYDACVQKFFEGAASGCVLIGLAPHNWEAFFPTELLYHCQPEDVNDAIDDFLRHEERRRELSEATREYAVKHHSIERRAEQIMALLEDEL